MPSSCVVPHLHHQQVVVGLVVDDLLGSNTSQLLVIALYLDELYSALMDGRLAKPMLTFNMSRLVQWAVAFVYGICGQTVNTNGNSIRSILLAKPQLAEDLCCVGYLHDCS